eukprot:3214556-Alexandrium_andersonii.AAC.1
MLQVVGAVPRCGAQLLEDILRPRCLLQPGRVVCVHGVPIGDGVRDLLVHEQLQGALGVEEGHLFTPQPKPLRDAGEVVRRQGMP